MSINFFKEDVILNITTPKKRKDWIKYIIENEGFICKNINFILCSDEYLLKINREYLNHDYYTDVVTFDDVVDKDISGDIFISVERVKENAVEYGVPFDNELNRVIIHGVLHLIGFDDKEKPLKEIMTKKEDECLLKLLKF